MQVCHVVNSIRESSFSLDFCTALENYTAVEPTVVSLFESPELTHDPPFRIKDLDYDESIYQRSINLRKELERYELAHTHHNRSGALVELLTFGIDTPTVTTQHNAHSGYHFASRFINGLSNPFADAVVCVSDSVKESFYKWESVLINDSNVYVIYNGASFDRIKSRDSAFDLYTRCDIKQGATVIGSAGMHTQQKGYDTLIRAIQQLNQENQTKDDSNKPIELVLPGEGPLTPDLKNLARQLGIDNRINFTGFLPTRDDVYELMDAIDIFAMPSRWEGHSIAALEAMALGNPCVLSNIPSFEVFEDVALFHNVDDVQELTEQIKHLQADTQLQDTLGSKAQQLVESQFSMESTAKEYENLYSKL